MLSTSDKRFLKKAMKELNIPAVVVQWSDYTRTRHPDIWCLPGEKPPRIVVTAEWKRQSTRERQKRLLHELFHVIGLSHNEKIGYSTYPARDSFSRRAYEVLK